jgi:hypothetical protein
MTEPRTISWRPPAILGPPPDVDSGGTATSPLKLYQEFCPKSSGNATDFYNNTRKGRNFFITIKHFFLSHFERYNTRIVRDP